LEQLLRDVSRPRIPPLSENRPDLPSELSDVLERAMAIDSYARPDAGTLGRMLGRAAKWLPEEAETVEERFVTRVREKLTPGPVDRDRLCYLGEHLASAAFALFALLYVLPRVPFYPAGVIVPLIAVPAFVALLWPFGGAVLTLALLAPPIFAFGAGWGVIYLILAVAILGLLRWRRREWVVLWTCRASSGRCVCAALGSTIGVSERPCSGGDRWARGVGDPALHLQPCARSRIEGGRARSIPVEGPA